MQKDLVKNLLLLADIKVDGNRPWDIQVKNDLFYSRVLQDHNLGMGESYMQGWIECEALDQFIYRILSTNLAQYLKFSWKLVFHALYSKLFNLGSKSHAFEVGVKHYDIGNELYSKMLDKRMVYTCGYWKNAQSLDQAQEAKLDLICRKINLKPGMKILDIGCGWGSFIKFAAEKYGVEAVGITVSVEQAKLARESCKGLPVDIRVQDYRDLKNEEYDCIVSIGMFEHVCYKNYRVFMEIAKQNLKENGLFLLHTIGGLKSITTSDPWINKYIFPNSMIPSIAQIAEASEGLFVMEDLHNFGADYDRTLMEWYKNISSRWEELPDKYDEVFKRMWKYYLLTCAGSFRARHNQLWQMVFSKHGVPGGYQAVR